MKLSNDVEKYEIEVTKMGQNYSLFLKVYSFVASFPGLPHTIAFSIYLRRHFRDQQSFRESIQVWQRFSGVH